ncbi:MAG TPA: Rieske 2Fe-2S domain-containing protein [Gammaproteobacteria bacterium]|nr:Rieske 2Fe-2S domain-containing protein [Gammaproteobacteria bacterium]
MSEALDFLLRVRPEAMQAHFAFFKDAGGRLDPKTRSLLSFISKVEAQSGPGLKQYLRRALQEGWSGGELLDAMLLSLPVLGLSKIVWAVEVINGMGLPEFREEALRAQVQWHEVIPLDALMLGRPWTMECDGRSLLVMQYPNEEPRVYDRRCPHQGTLIPESALAGNQLTCPKHGWTFDVRDGACVKIGNQPLKRYECKSEGGKLFVRW